tara:strand:+ start:151 stop:333 length:183 start_codon:yes stop_codon:yes gene_type:complete
MLFIVVVSEISEPKMCSGCLALEKFWSELLEKFSYADSPSQAIDSMQKGIFSTDLWRCSI